jgi:hypothetical protein
LDVRPDWQVVDQINFSSLTKLTVDEDYTAEDLYVGHFVFLAHGCSFVLSAV